MRKELVPDFIRVRALILLGHSRQGLEVKDCRPFLWRRKLWDSL